MSLQYSYALLEKNFSHEFRERLSHAEDIGDVSNQFSHTIAKMLNKIFEGKFTVKDSDIIFEPNEEKHYSFSLKLQNNVDFTDVLENSGLGSIVSRFVETAHHRYLHLLKHLEKSNSKIRHKI